MSDVQHECPTSIVWMLHSECPEVSKQRQAVSGWKYLVESRSRVFGCMLAVQSPWKHFLLYNITALFSSSFDIQDWLWRQLFSSLSAMQQLYCDNVTLISTFYNNNMVPSGGGTGTGDWKTDGQHYRRCQGVQLPVPAAVRGTTEGECSLISKHVHHQLARCNPLFHMFNVSVPTGFVLVGQK